MNEKTEIWISPLAMLIRFNNWITRLRRVSVQPANLLLLAPHCLQTTGCRQAVKDGIDNCLKCGRCDIAGLIAIRDRYGILCSIAGGGRQALLVLRNPAIKAVVAVACEKEIADGIRAAIPKPVLAVVNKRPNGPCKDTRVPLAEVEQAVVSLLNKPDKIHPEEPGTS